MAKETSLRPGFLFGISVVMICAGWIVKPFPLFVMAGLAPLFGILDNIKNEARFWNLSELILAALAIAFFAGHGFIVGSIVITLFQAIIMTSAFLAGSYVYRNLGAGSWTIIIFWLALEYLLAVLSLRNEFIYIGDGMSSHLNWLTWTSQTGYSGVSLWILLTNYLLYMGALKHGGLNWFFLGTAILLITGPIAFSYFQDSGQYLRVDMLNNYSSLKLGDGFLRESEVIHSVAAGGAVVLLVGAVVRNKA